MAIGDLISATDYNSIRTNIVKVMSSSFSGSEASYGYGQSIFSSAVTVGNQITKTQWDQLRYDIYNALLHQTGTAPTSMVTVQTTDVIRYGAGNPNTQYSSLALTAQSNRFDLGAGQFVTSALGSQSTSSSWSSSLSCTVTVTFSDAEKARNFFNAGGKIRFSSSRTGGTSVAQNTAWSNLLSSAGVQAFGANTGAVNFYNLTSSYQQFYSLSSSSPYSANSWRLEALCNAANNSTGTANIITFRVTWIDNYTDPGPGGPGDSVDGTLSLAVDSVRAYGVLQPTGTAGSFSVDGPASTVISSISGS
jgi:hypothetical protein